MGIMPPAMMPSTTSCLVDRMSSEVYLVLMSSLSFSTPGTSVIKISFSALSAAATCRTTNMLSAVSYFGMLGVNLLSWCLMKQGHVSPTVQECQLFKPLTALFAHRWAAMIPNDSTVNAGAHVIAAMSSCCHWNHGWGFHHLASSDVRIDIQRLTSDRVCSY